MTEIVAISSNPNTVVLTGTTAGTGSAVISNLNTTNLFVGMKVSGTGIADGSIITSINSGANTATMNKNSNDSITTSRSFTFTKTAYNCPTNPMLYVFDSATTTTRLNVVITPDNDGTSTVLTPLGRSLLANCTITRYSHLITLSSGNTDDLYVGQSIEHNKLQEDTIIDNILSSTTFTISKPATGTTASSQTVLLGIQNSNLATTDGFKIKCFDNTNETGVRINTWNENTHYLFVLIHSDDFSKHHFARVTEKLTEDIEGDAFEFEPKLGNEIPNGTKFILYSVPIPTSNHPLAIGAGIRNNPTYEIHCARPLFYFFNDYLDKKDELNHDRKHTIQFSAQDFSLGSVASASPDSHFTTKADFGTTIIDYSNFTLKTKLIDKLKEQDNPTTHTSNEGNTILDYTPFTNDACFTNARRDDNDTITDTASQDYNGEYRYVSYAYSKDKANLSYNVLDCFVNESFGKKGSIAEVKIADPYRILPKKIKEGESIRVRKQVFKGDMNEFKSISATITSIDSDGSFPLHEAILNTEHDLNNYLNVGDEVRIFNPTTSTHSDIVHVSHIGTFSSNTQGIGFANSYSVDDSTTLGTNNNQQTSTGAVNLSSFIGAEIQRRAYNRLDKTLFTDFIPINDRHGEIHIKLLSKDFPFLYVDVTSIDREKKLLTLSFANNPYNSILQSSLSNPYNINGGNLLDYMQGQYAITLEKFEGVVEKLEEYKENGLTQTKLVGRSNIRKLISPIINKNALFSEDVIYSTQSPYNKLSSISANLTSTFDSKFVFSSTVASISAISAGDKLHIKYDTGMMSYIGTVVSSGASVTLVGDLNGNTTINGLSSTSNLKVGMLVVNADVPTNTTITSIDSGVSITISASATSSASNTSIEFHYITLEDFSRAEGTALAGYKEANHNFVFNKALATNPYIESSTSLSGASSKGIFFKSGTLIDSTGAETTNLVGTSHSTNVNALGYNINEVKRMKSDPHFQSTLESSTFDTINTLMDFEVISTTSKDNGTDILIAPYMPLTLGRVDINYANTNDTSYSGTNLGRIVADATSVQRYIEVDADTALSSMNQLRGNRNMHNKPIYISGKFLANVIQVVKSTNTQIYLDRKVGYFTLDCVCVSGSTTLETPSTDNLFVGMELSGTGIASGTTITEIVDTAKITISASATSSQTSSITFKFKSGMQIDKLNGHAKEDVSILSKATKETKESSKLTHELSLLNGAHLHGAKTIGLIHPKLQTGNTYNKTSLLNYPIVTTQPFHTHFKNSNLGDKAYHYAGVGLTQADEMPKSSQEIFGTPLYRLLNIEKGNVNRVIPKVLGSTEQYYLETKSKIPYYASSYRFNAGHYIDGIEQTNIIGTDIMGLSFVGFSEIETFDGSSFIEHNLKSSSYGGIEALSFPRVGQKIVADGVPANTFVESLVGVSSGSTETHEVILTNNATASASGVTTKFFQFDYKRIPESRGLLPSTGSKFFDMTTLEKHGTHPIESSNEYTYDMDGFHSGSYPIVLLPPTPVTETQTVGSTKLHSPFLVKDRFGHLDPKVARMFLFSNSDLLPYSSTRKDSLMYGGKNRDLTKYSIMFLKDTTSSDYREPKDALGFIGKTSSITRLDNEYSSSIITSVTGKEIRNLKRFSIMRLTEVVYDFCFNQIDPENPPSKNITIPQTIYPFTHMKRVTDGSGGDEGLHINSISTNTLNLSGNWSGGTAGDIICDKEGRYIGVVLSIGTNTITLVSTPVKTTVNASGVSVDYFDYQVDKSGSVPTESRQYPLYYIPVETQDVASASNTTGYSFMKGMGDNGDFESISQTIHLLKGAVMRGIAEHNNGSIIQTLRGDDDAGFGGDDSGETDTSYFNNVGELIQGKNRTFSPFMTENATDATVGIGNGETDVNLWLPINFGYRPNIFMVANKSSTSDVSTRGEYGTNAPFPLFMEYMASRNISSASGDTTEPYAYVKRQVVGIDHSGAAVTSEHRIRHSLFGQILQNFKPIFFDNFEITGGEGAKVVSGMVGTRITGVSKVAHLENAGYLQSRVGISMNERQSGDEIQYGGFANSKAGDNKIVDSPITGSNSVTYANDADGVMYGFKPILKLDIGYQLQEFTFSNSGDFRARATGSDLFAIDGVGLTKSSASSISSVGNMIATQAYIRTGTDTYATDKVPEGTCIRAFTSYVSPSTVHYIYMDKNATSSGTDTITVSRNFIGTKKGSNGTDIHTFWLTDADLKSVGIGGVSDMYGSHNPMWLSNVDLTGCYLVSEAGEYYHSSDGVLVQNNNLDSLNLDTKPFAGSHGVYEDTHSFRYSSDSVTPKHILYVLSHEIDTTDSSRKHIITVSGTLPDPITTSHAAAVFNRMNHRQRFQYFKIMQPNHTCFNSFSPKNIRLNEMSSKYTKKPYDNANYDEINAYQIKNGAGSRPYESNNEGVLSMYVIVDADNQTNTGNLVITSPVSLRNNILAEGNTKILFSDGENQNYTDVEFVDEQDNAGFYLKLKKQTELLGVVSASEAITVTIPEKVSGAKRALIGSVVNVGTDSDLLINDLLEENEITFTIDKNETYPLIVSPKFTGVDLYSAITFLMNKKNKKLIENGSSFSIKDDDSSLQSKLFLTTQSTDNEIFTYKKTKSSFDKFNDISVFGRNHKAIRKEMKSIKKDGIKSLQVFEEELITQSEVDKRANELLKLHNEDNFNLNLTVGHKNMSQLKAGDMITVEILEENIPRSEFLVLDIQHSLSGMMELELGKYIKGLEDRFAELNIANRKTNNRLNEDLIDLNSTQFSFFDKIKIKPIRMLIRKKSVTAGSFTLNTASTTLNTSTSPLNIGTTIFTTLEEEDF